jgi:hypothetical protein
MLWFGNTVIIFSFKFAILFVIFLALDSEDKMNQYPTRFEVRFCLSSENPKQGEGSRLGSHSVSYIFEEVLFIPPFVKHLIHWPLPLNTCTHSVRAAIRVSHSSFGSSVDAHFEPVLTYLYC